MTDAPDRTFSNLRKYCFSMWSVQAQATEGTVNEMVKAWGDRKPFTTSECRQRMLFLNLTVFENLPTSRKQILQGVGWATIFLQNK